MPGVAKRHIFFVDDEPKIRKVVSETLKEFGLKVSSFACAADCLRQLNPIMCDLLITDVKMPGMDGIELLTEIKRIAPWLPVLLITGYGDIPMAVRATKAGAVDFIEKPLDKESFLNKVKSILHRSPLNDPYIVRRPLTKAEVVVLKLISQGKTNREIANLLNRSVRTIEVHRSHIMRKFGVDNLADLLKRAAVMELV
jgi:two-component system, LuxR family, response regulator FixJ